MGTLKEIFEQQKKKELHKKITEAKKILSEKKENALDPKLIKEFSKRYSNKTFITESKKGLLFEAIDKQELKTIVDRFKQLQTLTFQLDIPELNKAIAEAKAQIRAAAAQGSSAKLGNVIVFMDALKRGFSQIPEIIDLYTENMDDTKTFTSQMDDMKALNQLKATIRKSFEAPDKWFTAFRKGGGIPFVENLNTAIGEILDNIPINSLKKFSADMNNFVMPVKTLQAVAAAADKEILNSSDESMPQSASVDQKSLEGAKEGDIEAKSEKGPKLDSPEDLAKTLSKFANDLATHLVTKFKADDQAVKKEISNILTPATKNLIDLWDNMSKGEGFSFADQFKAIENKNNPEKPVPVAKAVAKPKPKIAAAK